MTPDQLLGRLADRYYHETVQLREELAELQARYDRLAAFVSENAGHSQPPRKV